DYYFQVYDSSTNLLF
nr:immunoglobulin light chain junction region [Macaca mulatta]